MSGHIVAASAGSAMDDDVPGLVPVGDVVLELAMPVAELAAGTPVDEPDGDASDDQLLAGLSHGAFLTPRRLKLDVPLELVARRDSERLVLGSSLPRQPIVTSLMPVYHRLSISVDIDG